MHQTYVGISSGGARNTGPPKHCFRHTSGSPMIIGAALSGPSSTSKPTAHLALGGTRVYTFQKSAGSASTLLGTPGQASPVGGGMHAAHHFGNGKMATGARH